MNIRDIPIPARLRDLPLDPRGFPITFTTTVDADGKPDFRVPDAQKWAVMCYEHLCAVCGQRLDYWIFFVGGEELFADRLFFEGPMHRECAEYSIKVCPFMALEKFKRTDREFTGDAAMLNEIDFQQARPARFGLGRTRGYKMVKVDVTEQMTRGPLSYAVQPSARSLVLIKAEDFKEIQWFTTA